MRSVRRCVRRAGGVSRGGLSASSGDGSGRAYGRPKRQRLSACPRSSGAAGSVRVAACLLWLWSSRRAGICRSSSGKRSRSCERRATAHERSAAGSVVMHRPSLASFAATRPRGLRTLGYRATTAQPWIKANCRRGPNSDVVTVHSRACGGHQLRWASQPSKLDNSTLAGAPLGCTPTRKREPTGGNGSPVSRSGRRFSPDRACCSYGSTPPSRTTTVLGERHSRWLRRSRSDRLETSPGPLIGPPRFLNR